MNDGFEIAPVGSPNTRETNIRFINCVGHFSGARNSVNSPGDYAKNNASIQNQMILCRVDIKLL
jgi:hypothetical protein